VRWGWCLCGDGGGDLGGRCAPLEPAGEPGQPLAHRRLEERAIRGGWLQHGPERERIMGRLLRVIDRPDEEGAHDRYAIAAARALMSADLRQQTLDQQREQAATAAYERAAAATGGPGQTDPIDPARYDWYGESCPCGLPAGECREHPRARASQRPPDGAGPAGS